MERARVGWGHLSLLVYGLNFFVILAGRCGSVVVRERLGYERSGVEVQVRPCVSI